MMLHKCNLQLLAVLVLMMTSSVQTQNSRQRNSRPARRESQGASYATQKMKPLYRAKERTREKGGRRPNIVLVLTDDQDVELGSLQFMPKLAKHMSAEGATFSNGFVSTPMCCPSRSSLLTGLYVHNHAVYTNNDNCSSSHWIQEHEPRTFATYLQDSGYNTAYFGKYLNKYSGTHIPPGWSEWQGLIRNSRFYNYTLNVNGALHHHGFDYEKDYLPDIITNRSLDYLRWSLTTSPETPVLTVLSYPGPHGPEDSAPQYQHLFHNVTTHHTPAYDFAPNPDKQWILRETGKMAPVQRHFTDMLMTKRLQTLQSIDEGVQRLITMLKDLDEIDNTYVFYTSDHGYHLGQYGLVKGKAFPFDVDTRVPLIVRGPGVPQNAHYPQPVVNIDLAPTFLDAAGLDPPPHMDGRSMLDVFRMQNNENTDGDKSHMENSALWRDAFLIERGKMTLERYMKVSALANSSNPDLDSITGLLFSKNRLTKRERVEIECKKPRYQLPCSPGQKWFCKERKDGVMKMRRCPSTNQGSCACNEVTDFPKLSGSREVDDSTTGVSSLLGVGDGKLVVGRKSGNFVIRKYARLAPKERNSQKNFIKKHVTNSGKIRPRFLKMLRGRSYRRSRNGARRWRRSNRSLIEEAHLEGIFEDVADQEIDEVDAMVQDITAELRDLHNYEGRNTSVRGGVDAPQSPLGTEEDQLKCVNNINSVICSQDLSRVELSWDASRLAVKQEIQRLRAQLHELKQIRRYLHIRRPLKKQHRRSRLFNLKSMTGSSTVIPSDNDSVTAAAAPESGCSCKGETAAEVLRRRREKKLEKLRRKQAKREKLERKLARKLNPRKADHCKADVKMNCFSHDNNHWKTPPLWTEGPFCACTNSNNNTYWCVRNINSTHNYLYCEYVTGMVTYFDLRVDPHQLRNLLHTLTDNEINFMHSQVAYLREYKAADQFRADQDSVSAKSRKSVRRRSKKLERRLRNLMNEAADRFTSSDIDKSEMIRNLQRRIRQNERLRRRNRGDHRH